MLHHKDLHCDGAAGCVHRGSGASVHASAYVYISTITSLAARAEDEHVPAVCLLRPIMLQIRNNIKEVSRFFEIYHTGGKYVRRRFGLSVWLTATS